jgi:hypothetical protein
MADWTFASQNSAITGSLHSEGRVLNRISKVRGGSGRRIVAILSVTFEKRHNQTLGGHRRGLTEARHGCSVLPDSSWLDILPGSMEA